MYIRGLLSCLKLGAATITQLESGRLLGRCVRLQGFIMCPASALPLYEPVGCRSPTAGAGAAGGWARLLGGPAGGEGGGGSSGGVAAGDGKFQGSGRQLGGGPGSPPAAPRAAAAAAAEARVAALGGRPRSAGDGSSASSGAGAAGV